MVMSLNEVADQVPDSPVDSPLVMRHQESIDEELNEDEQSKASGKTVVVMHQQVASAEKQHEPTKMLVSRESSLDEERKLMMSVDDIELETRSNRTLDEKDSLVARMRDIVEGGQKKSQSGQHQAKSSSGDSFDNQAETSKTFLESGAQQKRSRQHVKSHLNRHHSHHHHYHHQHRASLGGIIMNQPSVQHQRHSTGQHSHSHPHHHHHHHHSHAHNHPQQSLVSGESSNKRSSSQRPLAQPQVDSSLSGPQSGETSNKQADSKSSTSSLSSTTHLQRQQKQDVRLKGCNTEELDPNANNPERTDENRVKHCVHHPAGHHHHHHHHHHHMQHSADQPLGHHHHYHTHQGRHHHHRNHKKRLVLDEDKPPIGNDELDRVLIDPSTAKRSDQSEKSKILSGSQETTTDRAPLQKLSVQTNSNSSSCCYHHEHQHRAQKHIHPHHHHHHHSHQEQDKDAFQSDQQQLSISRAHHHHHHHHHHHRHHHHHGHHGKQKHRSKHKNSNSNINELQTQELSGDGERSSQDREQAGKQEAIDETILGDQTCRAQTHDPDVTKMHLDIEAQNEAKLNDKPVKYQSADVRMDMSGQEAVVKPAQEIDFELKAKSSFVDSIELEATAYKPRTAIETSKLTDQQNQEPRQQVKESDFGSQGVSGINDATKPDSSHEFVRAQESSINSKKDKHDQLVRQLSSSRENSPKEGIGGPSKSEQPIECMPLEPGAYQQQSGLPKQVVESTVAPDRRCRLCWCWCCPCSGLSNKSNPSKSETKPSNEPSSSSDNKCPSLPNVSIEKIRSWADSFDRLMKCQDGRRIFQDFLRCEYSEENILFWIACEELKSEKDLKNIEIKARDIYEDYISILSAKEVSLDSRVRDVINNNIKKPTSNIFDEAQLQIYTLMHRDSYPRFINSPMYKKLAQVQTTSRKSSS